MFRDSQGFSLADTSTQKAAKLVETRKKANFSVTGMTCSACVATIENFVSTTPGISRITQGVLNISVGLIQEKAEVSYDPAQITSKDIADNIEMIGFHAVGV